MTGTFAITFDIDWAPDWCIEECAAQCREFGVPATFFVTHACSALRNLAEDPLFELGIHPNFLSHCTRDGWRTVLDGCMETVPDAQSIRTHGLVQSSALFATIADDYQNILTDVSVLLPFHPNLCPTDLYIGRSCRRLTRLPYFWEDDVAANWPGWDWTAPIPSHPGLKIFDFHPIHVALNTRELTRYESLKRAIDPAPLHDASRKDCAPFVNEGFGTATFLRGLLEAKHQAEFLTVADITAQYRRQHP